jgi:hypothetical protein
MAGTPELKVLACFSPHSCYSIAILDDRLLAGLFVLLLGHDGPLPRFFPSNHGTLAIVLTIAIMMKLAIILAAVATVALTVPANAQDAHVGVGVGPIGAGVSVGDQFFPPNPSRRDNGE